VQWQYDMRNGKGELRSITGDLYQVRARHATRGSLVFLIWSPQGEFQANLRHGYGTIVYADGTRYSGAASLSSHIIRTHRHRQPGSDGAGGRTLEVRHASRLRRGRARGRGGLRGALPPVRSSLLLLLLMG
jgi:hypothetical protein